MANTSIGHATQWSVARGGFRDREVLLFDTKEEAEREAWKNGGFVMPPDTVILEQNLKDAFYYGRLGKTTFEAWVTSAAEDWAEPLHNDAVQYINNKRRAAAT